MASNNLSKARHNFACVAKVCLDVMKLPLIDILNIYIKPVDLHKKIKNSQLTGGKYSLRQEQLKKCFISPPDIPNYCDFDVTLLYTLIRNLCPSLTPTQGWGIAPRTIDTSIGDDIERLRLFRNNCFAHADSTEIPDAEFENLWKDVKSTFKRIDKFTKTLGKTNYEQELNAIESCRFQSNDLKEYKFLLEAALEILRHSKDKGTSLSHNFNTLGKKLK